MHYLAKPRRGFMLGKFLPPHKGHRFLGDFAQESCEELTILVGSLPSEPIPGELRYEWMKQMFPRANVVWCNEILPQSPEEDPENFWDIWRDVCQRYSGEDSFDVVFASETYGHRLAKELGARFVPVDMVRGAVPTSGTAVRTDPFGNWDFIPDEVKPYFTKRVCMFGVESTGKTTLALELAKEYKTIMIPEYGRTYTETFGADVGPDDLRYIVNGHLASVTAAKKNANKLVIEDTDPVMTACWSDMLIGRRDEWFEEYSDLADLYILTDIDIPWVDDGTRYFSNDADRRRFHEVCENELKRRGANYVTISGDRQTRFFDAVKAIDEAFFRR